MDKEKKIDTLEKSKDHATKSFEIIDLVQIIDKDFKERYWRTWGHHYAIDAIFIFLISVVLILVSIVLFILLPFIGPETLETNLPIFLTSLAIIISFISLTLKVFSTPLASNRTEYTYDICKKNCELISHKHMCDNNLLLFILVKMKASSPKIKLADVHNLSPNLFQTDELVRRFYGHR